MENTQKAERMTGTRDTHYNLVSVLYHTLQGAETSMQYMTDAQESGDEELMRFFREVQDENRQLAERAKGLLAQRLSRGNHR
jgi:methylthioribose-1-phosphate isomerase